MLRCLHMGRQFGLNFCILLSFYFLVKLKKMFISELVQLAIWKDSSLPLFLLWNCIVHNLYQNIKRTWKLCNSQLAATFCNLYWSLSVKEKSFVIFHTKNSVHSNISQHQSYGPWIFAQESFVQSLCIWKQWLSASESLVLSSLTSMFYCLYKIAFVMYFQCCHLGWI